MDTLQISSKGFKKKVINSSNTNRGSEKPPTFSLRKKSSEMTSINNSKISSGLNKLSGPAVQKQNIYRRPQTRVGKHLDIKDTMSITMQSLQKQVFEQRKASYDGANTKKKSDLMKDKIQASPKNI